MREHLPGLALASTIGLLAYFLSGFIPNIGDVSLAIVLGIIAGNSLRLPPILAPGIAYCEKKLLPYAVVLMGFSLNMVTIHQLGLSSLILIILLIGTTILAGFFLAHFFGLSSSLGGLLGTGNAICGASAIAAASPLITKNQEEVGISIGVVNLIGTVGIFLLPLLTHFLRLDDRQASLLIGGSLQAVGHVIAAGYTLGGQVGEMATAVKMARIFMLAPTLMILAYTTKDHKSKASHPTLGLPFYLYGFMFCALINNLLWLPQQFTTSMQALSHILLIVAMAGLGLRIKLSSLLAQGPRALLLGTFVFCLQLTVLVGAIVWGQS